MGSRKIKGGWILVVTYLFLAFLFFITIGLDVLEEKATFQFYSDSKVWEEEALYPQFEDATAINHNTYGPVTILNILGPRNYWGIFAFNIIVFIISLYLIADNKEFKVNKLFFLVLLSPITFTSLLSINKEIFSLITTALIIYNHNKKKLLLIPLIIFVSYMSRWQFTLFYFVYLFTFSKFNFLKEKRFPFFLVLLSGITIMLFLLRNTLLYEVFSVYERVVDTNYEGGGTFRNLMTIQDKFGYIFAFIPKTLLILVANIRRYDKFFDFSDAYNNVILFLQTLYHIYILFLCYKHYIFKFRNTFFYLALIYFAIFCITPVYNPRYFYPALLFLCCELAKKRKKTNQIVYDKSTSLWINRC